MMQSTLIRIIYLPRSLLRRIELFAIRKSYGQNFLIGPYTRITSPRCIQLHDKGKLTLGSHVTLETDGVLNIEGDCKIGNQVYISVRFLLGCAQSVTIGNNVAIGPNVVIVDTNKNYSNSRIPIIHQGKQSSSVLIGSDCWIGANSVILPGTILGNHVVVGAGSVVKGSIPDNVLIAGVPARIIRSL